MTDQPSGNADPVLYQTKYGRTHIGCRFEGGTPWPVQEGELVKEATCKEYLHVRQEVQRAVTRSLRHYNLAANGTTS